MNKRRLLGIVLIVSLLMLTCACGSQAAPEQESRQMEGLGQEFVEEINVLLQYRESDERLKKSYTVFSTDRATYNIDLLLDFYNDYRAGQPAELISVTSTTTFLITKLVFDGENSYYYRYEYDRFNEDEIEITAQSLDSIELESNEGQARIRLMLKKEKAKEIVLTYKNIVDLSVFEKL